MKKSLVMWLVGMMLERVDSEEVSKWLLAGTALLRKWVIDSPNKYDDLIALPMLDIVEGMVARK